MSIDLEQVTRAYVNLRAALADSRREAEAREATFKEGMEKLENLMLKHLLDNNLESVRTEAGTFYKQVQTRPSGSDWEAFYKFVKDENAFDALERRIKAKFVEDYIEEHGSPPPGVSVHREAVVRVRKANS